MVNHCMIDLETLSTSPKAVILSLGAVAFDKKSGVTSRFYVNFDPADCIYRGLAVSESTVAWWEKQSAEAQDALKVDQQLLHDGLKLFCDWVRNTGVTRLWGNGADFDNPILRHAFEALDADIPFKPWNGRCYRTIKNIDFLSDVQIENRIGTYHNALDDAETQAEHLLRLNAVFKDRTGVDLLE